MKEFEKWWDNLDTKSLPKEYSPFEEGWRAALEWVKNNCDLYDRCGGWEGYIVEEELES